MKLDIIKIKICDYFLQSKIPWKQKNKTTKKRDTNCCRMFLKFDVLFLLAIFICLRYLSSHPEINLGSTKWLDLNSKKKNQNNILHMLTFHISSFVNWLYLYGNVVG